MSFTNRKMPNVSEKAEEINVMPTSANSAEATPILLNESNLLRFMFIPILVNNARDSKKAVKGKLIFEKKHIKDNFFPSEKNGIDGKISRGVIKVGNWTELQFDTCETFNLYMGLKDLYELSHNIESLPHVASKFTKVDDEISRLISIIKNDPGIAEKLSNEENYELIKMLLGLLKNGSTYESLKKGLSEVQNNNITKLSETLTVEKLKRIYKLMIENLDNAREEFWQTSVFKDNQWILAQIFSCPCTIFASKAYVGGKSINNDNGNICDFLYKNSLTRNVALIEIKTPCTKIIGNFYRGTYSFSEEFSGAINQVINYRDKFIKDYYSLCKNSDETYEAFSPKCVVVIGKIESLDKKEIAALESFRNNLSNVTVITFDELSKKIKSLIEIMSEDI